MWQILITLQNPLTKDFRRISFESSGSFGQSYQIVMEDTLCRCHLQYQVCKEHGQGRHAKFDRGGTSSNKGIRDAGSTADFKILFEIFETLEIFDFFKTFNFF